MPTAIALFSTSKRRAEGTPGFDKSAVAGDGRSPLGVAFARLRLSPLLGQGGRRVSGSQLDPRRGVCKRVSPTPSGAPWIAHSVAQPRRSEKSRERDFRGVPPSSDAHQVAHRREVGRVDCPSTAEERFEYRVKVRRRFGVARNRSIACGTVTHDKTRSPDGRNRRRRRRARRARRSPSSRWRSRSCSRYWRVLQRQIASTRGATGREPPISRQARLKTPGTGNALPGKRRLDARAGGVLGNRNSATCVSASIGVTSTRARGSPPWDRTGRRVDANKAIEHYAARAGCRCRTKPFELHPLLRRRAGDRRPRSSAALKQKTIFTATWCSSSQCFETCSSH